MQTITLAILNIMISTIGSINIYGKGLDSLESTLFAFNCIQILFFIGIMWKGTEYNDLFSRPKLIIVGTFLLLDILFSVFQFVDVSQKHETFLEISSDNFMINILQDSNNFYIHL